MEREFSLEVAVESENDVALEPFDLAPLPPRSPPEGEPRPGAPLGFDADPTTGPWFPLSMAVSAGWALLTLLTLGAGRAGGFVVAWALIAGFTMLFVGFLATGAVWFGRWRR